jgi:hypothetical protein
MTIQRSYAGNYQVLCNLAYNGNTSGNRVVDIVLNGSTLPRAIRVLLQLMQLRCTITFMYLADSPATTLRQPINQLQDRWNRTVIGDHSFA